MQAYNEIGGAGERGKQKTVKPGPAIDAKLYKELVAVTKENGRSQRYQLERFIDPCTIPGDDRAVSRVQPRSHQPGAQ